MHSNPVVLCIIKKDDTLRLGGTSSDAVLETTANLDYIFLLYFTAYSDDMISTGRVQPMNVQKKPNA